MIENETNLKEYELTFLLEKPEAEASVNELISRHGGEVVQKSPVRDLRLAYPIKKRQTALFGAYLMKLPADQLKEFSHNLRLIAGVLRFLVVVPPKVRPLPVRNKEAEAAPEKPVVARRPVQSEALTNQALEEQLKMLSK
jgi:ribosomal protein S6